MSIVLAADGPIVNGQVKDKNNRPVGKATVVLSASPLPTAFAPNQILTLTTGADGQFSFTGMSPGY